WLCEYPGLSFQRSPVRAYSLVSSLLLNGATMSQQSSLTQSAHSVRQLLTAYNRQISPRKEDAKSVYGRMLSSQSPRRAALTAHFGKFVAYYRVSTDKQGHSGLGLDAQRQAVMTYLNGGPWKLIAEFTEVETGKRGDRPELQKALAACRKHKAKLILANLHPLPPNPPSIPTP